MTPTMQFLLANAMTSHPEAFDYRPRRIILPSEERAKAIGAMIRKGKETIAQKQAFLHASSKQKKVMWRNDPSNPKRVA